MLDSMELELQMVVSSLVWVLSPLEEQLLLTLSHPSSLKIYFFISSIFNLADYEKTTLLVS